MRDVAGDTNIHSITSHFLTNTLASMSMSWIGRFDSEIRLRFLWRTSSGCHLSYGHFTLLLNLPSILLASFLLQDLWRLKRDWNEPHFFIKISNILISNANTDHIKIHQSNIGPNQTEAADELKIPNALNWMRHCSIVVVEMSEKGDRFMTTELCYSLIPRSFCLGYGSQCLQMKSYAANRVWKVLELTDGITFQQRWIPLISSRSANNRMNSVKMISVGTVQK